MMMVNPVNFMYAGIGRPYTLGILSVLSAAAAYALCSPKRGESVKTWYYLCAQSTLWMSWLIIFPFVASDLINHFRRRRGWLYAIRPYALYVLVSLVLLAYLGVQIQNPQLGGKVVGARFGQIMEHIRLATPLSFVGALHPSLEYVGTTLFFAFVAIGTWLMACNRWNMKGAQWGLIGGLAASVLAPFLMASEQRHLTVAMTLPTLFAGLALSDLLGRSRVLIAIAAMSAGSTIAWASEDLPAPYDLKVAGQGPYSDLARTVEYCEPRQGAWASYPYYIQNNLYRYASLPEPLNILSFAHLKDCMAQLRPTEAFVLVGKSSVFEGITDEVVDDLLKRGRRTEFADDFVVIELHPK
jgi:hypothetical protein